MSNNNCKCKICRLRRARTCRPNCPPLQPLVASQPLEPLPQSNTSVIGYDQKGLPIIRLYDIKALPRPLVTHSNGFGVQPVKAVYLGYQDTYDISTAVNTALNAGYNLILLAFWIDPQTGVDPYSAADRWTQLSPSDKQALKNAALLKGAKIVISVGGSTYNSYSTTNAAAYGQAAAQYALDNLLDGIDFDMENFRQGFTTDTGLTQDQTIQWLVDATTSASVLLQASLGSKAYISHAPQAPYFGVEFDSGYLKFWKTSPPVQAFLIQYYNQSFYESYATQFISADPYHPGTAVAQLIANGIPQNAIVVGRLTQPGDGDPTTWVAPQTLRDWRVTAASDPQASNWQTGFSTWQFNISGDPTSTEWIQTIYS